MPKWLERWKGGRTAKVDGVVVYYIERSIGPRGHRRTYTKRLGPITLAQAEAELALFERDPDAYRTPTEAKAENRAAREAATKAEDAARIDLSAELLEKFTEALREGYGTNKPVSEHYAFVVHSYLSKWATSPLLEGRDLRTVTVADLRRQLDDWKTSKKHRIVALKTFTAWLRWRGDLKLAEDPTLALNVPQARRLSPAEKAKKVYPLELLEAVYRHIPNQRVRDLFRVRIATGLHVSEIARIVHGEAVVREVDAGEIAAVVDVTHKSGQEHRQSIDQTTLLTLRRMMTAGTVPLEKTLERSLTRASEAAGVERVYMANLRHTFATLATQVGRVVTAEQAKGVPMSLVAQIIGHRDPSTTKAFYYGVDIPPMVVLPLALRHPSDPIPAPPPGVIPLRPARQQASGKSLSRAVAESSTGRDRKPRRSGRRVAE